MSLISDFERVTEDEDSRPPSRLGGDPTVEPAAADEEAARWAHLEGLRELRAAGRPDLPERPHGIVPNRPD